MANRYWLPLLDLRDEDDRLFNSVMADLVAKMNSEKRLYEIKKEADKVPSPPLNLEEII